MVVSLNFYLALLAFTLVLNDGYCKTWSFFTFFIICISSFFLSPFFFLSIRPLAVMQVKLARKLLNISCVQIQGPHPSN